MQRAVVVLGNARAMPRFIIAACTQVGVRLRGDKTNAWAILRPWRSSLLVSNTNTTCLFNISLVKNLNARRAIAVFFFCLEATSKPGASIPASLMMRPLAVLNVWELSTSTMVVLFCVGARQPGNISSACNQEGEKNKANNPKRHQMPARDFSLWEGLSLTTIAAFR